MMHKSVLKQTNPAKRELSKPVNKMVHLRSVVKAELNTELKTELKTKSSLMNSSNPQYGKINRNGKCINASGPLDKSTLNQPSNNVKSGVKLNVTKTEFQKMKLVLKSNRMENRKIMESIVQQLELETDPKQSSKQLDGDVKCTRTVKPPPVLDKRLPLKTQIHSQANVTTKGKNSMLEKQVVRLRDELETEQGKIAELMARKEMLQEQNAELNETIQIQSREIEKISYGAQITSRTVENLQKENAELKEIIQKQTKEIVKLSNNTHSAFEREQKLLKENAELEKTIQIQSKDVVKFSNEAEIAVETTKKLKKEIQEAIEAKNIAVKNGDAHYDEATKLMARMDRMENFITTLCTENESLRMENKSLVKKNESLSASCDWMESVDYEMKLQRHKMNLIQLDEANENMLKIFHQEVDRFKQEKEEQERIFNLERKKIRGTIRRKNSEIDSYKEEIKNLKYNLRYYQDYDDNAKPIFADPSTYGGVERVTKLRLLN